MDNGAFRRNSKTAGLQQKFTHACKHACITLSMSRSSIMYKCGYQVNTNLGMSMLPAINFP